MQPRSRESRLTKNVNDLRLLQFAPRLPWPLDTGAKLRNYHLARVIATKMPVTLLAFGTYADDNSLGEIYQRVVAVPRAEEYSVGNVVRGALGRTPLPLLNYTTAEMSRAVTQLLEENQFDLVQVESVHLLNYVPLFRGARARPLVICDWHNVESDLMQQYAKHERNAARRIYARRTARLLRAAEERALKEFDAHVVVSEADAKRLRAIEPSAKVLVIENGVDTSYYEHSQTATKSRVVFVASMDYHANIEGARDFARNVWPSIHENESDLRFAIVGRDPAPAVKELSSIAGVEVTGSVNDVRPFYREAVAAVVPLKVGGGSRLKILEAMAAGVPVVSTKLGAEGLDVSDGVNILFADSPAQFAEAIARVVHDSNLRNGLIDRALALVHSRYDWSMLGAKLVDQFQNLIETTRD